MKTQFLLARHGETEWNKLKKLQGRLDSPITDMGLRQAENLAGLLANESIDLIVTSPLPRAATTAHVCHNKLDIALKVHEDLVERHFGDWQGRLFNELNEQPHFADIFFKVTEHAPPGGETGEDCAQRFEQALIEIAAEHGSKKVLIVTHGDVLRCFSTQLKQVAFCDAYSQYGNGSVIRVEYDHPLQRFDFTVG